MPVPVAWRGPTLFPVVLTCSLLLNATSSNQACGTGHGACQATNYQTFRVYWTRIRIMTWTRDASHQHKSLHQVATRFSRGGSCHL